VVAALSADDADHVEQAVTSAWRLQTAPDAPEAIK
jgi:hypothetical protein